MAPPRGAACFAHKPELLVFAVDTDQELVASEAVPGWTRLDAVAHAAAALAAAKARVDARHRFALVALREGAEAVAESVTASPDALAARVRALGGAGGGGPGQSYASFEMASLPRAVEGFQALARATGAMLRVILIYGRSNVIPTPLPPPTPHARAPALAVDCLYLHDRPSPGANRPQEVYSALEDAADALSAVARHPALVFEAAGGNVRKLLTLAARLAAHPLQRQCAQAAAPPAVDLATAAPAVLPSERAAGAGAGGGGGGAAGSGAGGGGGGGAAARYMGSLLGRSVSAASGGGGGAAAAAAAAAAVAAAAAPAVAEAAPLVQLPVASSSDGGGAPLIAETAPQAPAAPAAAADGAAHYPWAVAGLGQGLPPLPPAAAGVGPPLVSPAATAAAAAATAAAARERINSGGGGGGGGGGGERMYERSGSFPIPGLAAGTGSEDESEDPSAPPAP